jgi:hypothetical protein
VLTNWIGGNFPSILFFALLDDDPRNSPSAGSVLRSEITDAPNPKSFTIVRMKKTVFFSILLLAFASSALAQKTYEPKKGSAERTAIMNAIRTYDVKRESGLANETFRVSALRVQGTWAYANVEQQGANSYGQAHVFLQKAAGKWRVAFSTYNDANEVGVDGLERLRKKNRSFPKGLADFAMKYLAG